MKRIVMVSDATSGGAAIACRRLVAGLKRLGRFDVMWVAASGDPKTGAIIAAHWPDAWALLWFRLMSGVKASPAAIRRAWCTLNERSVQASMRKLAPDLVNVHNIHAQMSPAFFDGLPVGVPVVWTLHDMWALTGYCCQSFDCDAFTSNCQIPCPQKGRWEPETESPADGWKSRERLFRSRGRPLRIVTPSEWLRRQAHARRLEASCIPNGVDTAVFRPVSSAAAREALGLPQRKRIILSSAHSFAPVFKGAEVLKELSASLSARWAEDAVLVTVGEAGERWTGAMTWLDQGPIADEKLLNLFYNAADVLVLPSRAENLPNILLEAAAAGVPSVAFRVGGCGEVIQEGSTGFLSDAGDVAQLASSVDRVLSLPADQARSMREQCRHRAESAYALEIQAGRYAGLFESLQ